MSSQPISTTLFSTDEYEIRPAKGSEEYKEMWWGFMQELGWNRGYYDLETYMNSSAGSGMLLLIDKSENTPIGHVAAVVNANGTGWIAMFIIKSEHRGKGWGRELFRAGMEDAKRSGVKILGLDGVAEQKATYGRRGFIESLLGTVDVMSRNLTSHQPIPSDLIPERKPGTHLLKIRQIPSELLVAHELKYTGFERPKLWSDELMWSRPDVLGFALTSKENPGKVDDLLAWTVVRRCSGGGRIGPLYASDAHSAKVVLVEAMNAVTPQYIKDVPLPKEPISHSSMGEIEVKGTMTMEIWTGNPEIVNLVMNTGWSKQLAFHRMWVDSKATPEQGEGGVGHKGIFAIFDAAIG